MKAPNDLTPKGRGRDFWKRVTDAFEDLGADEIEVLTESCRLLDVIDRLRAVVAKDGETSKGSRGQVVIHPAVAEMRQQQLVLARLLKQLGIPDTKAPALPDSVPSITSARARKAARARWG